MQKESWTWTTQHFPQPARLVRWGHFGTPVLLFPTAGGDFEEVERFNLISALGEWINNGRIKVYSVDAIAVRAWLAGTAPPVECARLQDRYDTFVYEDVLHRIRADCQNDKIEPILAGASLGAFAAVSGLLRHPDVFRSAIGLSGVYDLAETFGGVPSGDIGAFSPVGYLSGVGGGELDRLRQRLVVLGTGEGGYETPGESKGLAKALEAKGVPCRLTLSGTSHDHTWATWREMLPRAIADQVQSD